MGGALILVAIAVATLLWGDLTNPYIWIVLMVTGVFGAVGWVDDYRKVVERDSRGLPARWKYFWQSVGGLGAAIALYLLADQPAETQLFLPFVKSRQGLNLVANFRVAGQISRFDPALADLPGRFHFGPVIFRFLPPIHQTGRLPGDLATKFRGRHSRGLS